MNIRIVSPSATLDVNYIYGAAEVLRGWGHEVTIGKYVSDRRGMYASTAENRLSDLNEALADDSVDAILCARGGYGMAQIVDKVQISKPKMILGFSDITCLHCLCGSMGLPSVHSIMAKHISTLPSDSEPIVALRGLLDGKGLKYDLPTSQYSRQGEVEGVLRGGNLSVFYGLQGTPYQVRHEDTILFIEDIDEPQYHIDRMLQNLRLSGLIDSLKGVVIGQFADCRDDVERMTIDLQRTLLRAFDNRPIPIVYDFPAGHVDDNRPLVMNAKVKISVTEQRTILVQDPFYIGSMSA